jgi:hypothetical protein
VYRISPVATLFAAAIVASILHGSPQRLPGAALGWSPLFHVERAAALLSASAAVIFVGWKSLRGEFPIRIGGIEYPGKDADLQSKRTLSLYETRLELLERKVFGVSYPTPPTEGDHNQSYTERS